MAGTKHALPAIFAWALSTAWSFRPAFSGCPDELILVQYSVRPKIQSLRSFYQRIPLCLSIIPAGADPPYPV
jgi:hypothetical protein